MEKIIQFEPAYDKRHSNPKKNYGIHGVNIRFLLKGERGATQFLIFTNWQLPHVQKELRVDMRPDKYFIFEPMAADLGYHSPVPIYEGQSSLGACPVLDGKDCYYDGSGLNAEPVYKILLEKGHEGVWKELEEYYVLTFGELI